MADYHPERECVLQKGGEGHREQDPDLYDWFAHSTLEGEQRGLARRGQGSDVNRAILRADVCSLESHGDIAEIPAH